MKVCHIYATKSIKNSGDFIIGKATKKYVEEKIFKQKIIEWTDFSCWDIFNAQRIDLINKNFDAVICGAGGLIQPDCFPNNTSCWQWNIHKDNIIKINIPIYVISIGYNLFKKQTMNMPFKLNNNTVDKRLTIFKENIETLIDKSKMFTMRHNKDIHKIKKIVDKKFHDKIKFMFCPTIWYCKKYWLPKEQKLRMLFYRRKTRKILIWN